MLIWATAAMALLVVSSTATFLTMLHLRCRWDVHASSVRWLFWVFFLFIWIWCSLRAVFFVWLAPHDPQDPINKSDPVRHLTYGDVDRMGSHGVLYLEETKALWFIVLFGVAHTGLLGVALTLYPLTYELSRLARVSMDRGVVKERKQIHRYRTAIAIALVVYGIIYTVLAICHGGYTEHTNRTVLVVYLIQFIGLAYMVFQLVRLKVSGRKFETIHGTFVASPVYHRLKLIMLVYAVFSFQFQFSMVIIYLYSIKPDGSVGRATGVSRLIYNAAGLALSITTSCSQACVFSACARCLPEDFEAQILHQRFMTSPNEDLAPPRDSPVFVYTDIESSSALWNTNGEMMGAATEIHDTILRSTLIKHRGYEVATVGDAFQIAFHNPRDAIEYCLDVQLLLLTATWPKEIEGVVPATVKERAGRRVIFNGLRVRMGIHDANESEGMLVRGTHSVTGKATYTGVSEVIAEYVGDLGSGGQILMTERVATWLKHHRDKLSVDVYLEYMGEYTVPQVNANVTLYQVLPMMLAERRRHFAMLRIEFMQRQIRLSHREDCRFIWNTPVMSPVSSEGVSVATSPMESVGSGSGVEVHPTQFQYEDHHTTKYTTVPGRRFLLGEPPSP